MTTAELVAASGKSQQAISKAKLPHIKNSRGACEYDPNDPRVQDFIKSKREGCRIGKRAAAREKIRSAPVLEAPDPIIPFRPAGPISPTPPGSPGDVWDDLDAQKTRQQIEKLRLENEETRKELIPRADVKDWAGQFYGVHSSILIPLGSKIGPDVAACLGVTDDASILAAQKIVDDEIYGALAQIESIMQAYLASIES